MAGRAFSSCSARSSTSRPIQHNLIFSQTFLNLIHIVSQEFVTLKTLLVFLVLSIWFDKIRTWCWSPSPEDSCSTRTYSISDMSIISIENHLNVALISLTIAPSTCIALAILLFIYLYILHVRNNPIRNLHRDRFLENHDTNTNNTPHPHGGNNRGARMPLRRPSILKRISTRFRARKQRDRPALPIIPPVWIPVPSLWLSLRQRVGDGGFGFGRQIQSAGVATRRQRQSQQRLLE